MGCSSQVLALALGMGRSSQLLPLASGLGWLSGSLPLASDVRWLLLAAPDLGCRVGIVTWEFNQKELGYMKEGITSRT